MNKITSLHICRVLLVMLFVIAPFKAIAIGPSYTYYAKVYANISTGSTGYGTVYAGTSGANNVQQLSSSTSGDEVTATLRAIPNTGYYLKGWNTDNSNDVITDSDNNTYTTTVKVATTNGASEDYNYYAVFKAYVTYWAQMRALPSTSNTGFGTITINDNNVSELKVSNSQGKEEDGGINVPFTLNAVANQGSVFLGWSASADGSTPYVSTSPRTVFATSTDPSIPTTETLYAVFNKLPSITIKINGSNYGNGDNVVFNVNKTDSPTKSYTVPIKVSSSGSVTLKDLPIGTYSITPTSWAWNYAVTPVNSNTGVTVNTDTIFEFNVVGKSSTKEYDEKSKVNWGN